MSATYEVYSVTHPDDVTVCANIYDAHAIASELVEAGFDVRCERYGYSETVRVMGWSDLCAAVNGDG